MDLWQKLTRLCAVSADGIYRADWDKFYSDTGGYTINSLASYGLLARISLYLENGRTYHIRIVETTT